MSETSIPKPGRGNRNPRTPAQLESVKNNPGRNPKPALERRKPVKAYLNALELQSILERSGCSSFTVFAQAFAAGEIKIRK